VPAAEIGQLPSEIKGVLLACAFLDAGEAIFAALGDGDRAPCLAAWRALGRLGADERERTLATWRAEAASGLASGIEQIHPSWIRDVLAEEPASLLEHVRESLPAVLRPSLGAPRGRAGADPTAEIVNGVLGRDIVRIALAALAPLCEGGGPLAERLSKLGFEALEDEIARTGASVLGRSLVGSAPAVCARAMALVGEPLATVIAQALGERVSEDESRAASKRVAANVDVSAQTPRQRLLFIGLASLKEALEAESPGSAARVAGRLPVELGRRLLTRRRRWE
jgi:hypothetical protein